MAKQRNDHPVVLSPTSASIALLRERFKDLKRQKEMRQERDPLRFVNKVPNKVSGHHPTWGGCVARQERSLFNSISTSLRLSLSPVSNNAGDDITKGILVVARPASPASRHGAADVDDDDLDTSLHL